MKTIFNNQFFIRIILPSLLAFIIFVSTLFYIVIPAFEKAIMDRKREMIRELTNSVISIIAKYNNDEMRGLITRAEAQQIAISRIEYIRYGEEQKDYFWITDKSPKMIMHPYRPELNGKMLNDYKDSHGKLIFIETLEVINKHGSGYIDYMWQWKDDASYIVPKLSFVSEFEPWEWIIGTGIYIEDVKNEISKLNKASTQISIIVSIIIAIILLYLTRQSQRIEKKRLEAEKKLRESREKYRSLVEASTEGLLMIIDNKITYVNSLFVQMTGKTEDEILNSQLSDFFTINNTQKQNLTNVLENKKYANFETSLIINNNSNSDILLSASYIKFFEKDAIIISVKDIHSDKLIREELFQSREKFKVLMDKLNIGIFRTTIDNKGRFLDANKTALLTLGYKDISELNNSYILEIFADANDKKNFRRMLLDSGFLKNKHLKLYKKNGQTIIANVSMAVIYDKENKLTFCDGIIEEIFLKNKEDLNISDSSQNLSYINHLLLLHISSLATNLICCSANTSIANAANLMLLNNVKCIGITTDDDNLIGLVNDFDITQRVVARNYDTSLPVYTVMTAPIPYVNETTSVSDSLYYMNLNNLNNVVIKANVNNPRLVVNINNIVILQSLFTSELIASSNKSQTIKELKELRTKAVNHMIMLIDNGISPSTLFKVLSNVSDSITKRIIEMAIETIGEPPIDFAFIVLGSEGRTEQTFSTDQDNAIIYDDIPADLEEICSKYFKKLAENICANLHEVGFSYCKGGIMAMNKKWCQPISVWKNYFNNWINTANPQDLLDVNVFFDFRTVYGNNNYAEVLEDHINSISSNKSAFLFHLAQNTLRMKPQTGFWGGFQLESAGTPPETVNVKETLVPIVSFARIYSLQHNINSKNTSERLKTLYDINVIPKSTYIDLQQSFEFLSLIRMKHQAELIRNNVSPDNLVNTKTLSELDKTIVKKILSIISTVLTRLSFDYKGIN